MTGKAILTSRPTSHPFQDRTLILDHPVKIGRSVARARASSVNAIFDCKVLSRNHAVIWFNDGKFYLQDTRSSNGTYVNNQRLSKSGEESAPQEVSSGDIVQFGVEVLESTRKVTHGCIIANLKLYLPDGKEAKASDSSSLSSPKHVPVEDLYELHQYIQEAVQRESLLETKLLALQEMLNNIVAAADEGWKALICEDRLLTRVEALENQLQAYSKNYGEEKLKEEIKKLQEDKNQYQCAAKVFFKKVLEEKLEEVRKCQGVKRSLVNVEAQYSSLNEELTKNREHVQDLAQQLSAQIAKNEYYELKLQEVEDQHKEALAKLESKNIELEEMLFRQHATEARLAQQLQDINVDTESRSIEKTKSFELEWKPSSEGDGQGREGDDSVIKDENNGLDMEKDRHDNEKNNLEFVELLKAQLGLLDAEKLARLQQINSIQGNYEESNLKQLVLEEERQVMERRINNLESQIKQNTIQHSSPSFDGREIVNGLNDLSLEPLESEIKELKALRSDIENRSNACEKHKKCLKEELDQAKTNLSKTTESYLMTQENLVKAQKELDESSVIRNSPTSKMKKTEEYSISDEKLPFLDVTQNTLNKKSMDKEDILTLKKSLVEAQQREKQSKNEAAQLKDKIVALTAELENRTSSSEDNKLREELEENKQECAKSKTLISLLEMELKFLRDDYEQLNEACNKSIVNDICTTNDEIQDEAFSKLATLEEKLITLGTKYMECCDEKSKLQHRLEGLELDYQAISHQKYFNLFFALPCILLLLAFTTAFYPTLSFMMGTADHSDEIE